MRRIWVLWAILALFQTGGVQAQILVRGVVRDDDTGEPLSGATVEVTGTDKGVAAGEDGRFVLRAAAMPVAIEVRHVGYDPKELEIYEVGKGELEIRLTPLVYEMEGVVVEYLDPAVRIMREVIRSKRVWWRELEGFTAELYGRQTLYRDTDVVAVRESAARVYSDRKGGVREVVKARRYTANLPLELRGFSASEYAVDLYADEVEVLGQQLMGVTHPRALRHYLFRLAEENGEEGRRRYTIAVTPGEGLGHGFAGYVVVAEESYALVEARLRVAPAIQSAVFPSEQGIAFSFHQEFRRCEPGGYLPAVLRYEIEARFGTSPLGEELKRLRGVPTPRCRLQGVTRWQGQRVGVELPELFFADQALQVERDADQQVELLEPHWEEEPLSLREESAFARLQREGRPPGEAGVLFALYRKGAVAPEAAPHASDPLAEESAVGDEVVGAVVGMATGLDVDAVLQRRFVPEFGGELWFNRVDGAHAGLRTASRLSPGLGLFTKGGFNTGTEKGFYGAGLRQGWGPGKRGFAGVNFQEGTRPRYESESYSLAFNSLPALLSLDDYFDYYWSRRWSAEAGYYFDRPRSALQVGWSQEEANSLGKQTDFDLVCGFQNEEGRFYQAFCADRDEPQRENPAVAEGRLRAVEMRFTWGGEYRPFGRQAQRRGELRVEHSGEWLGSDFSFTRYRLSLDWQMGGLVRRAGLGEKAYCHLLAGTSTGKLPVQRFGALDAGIWIFQPFGAFRTLRGRPYEGERYGALFWEVELGGGLFEKLGMEGLARKGLELLAHGASGRTWIERERLGMLGYAPRYRDGFHHEIGMSLALRPLRLDASRRLDRAGWGIGCSLARVVE